MAKYYRPFGDGMWKVWMLFAFFIIFVALIAFVIVPTQRGNTTSTQLQASSLQQVNSTYNETLPIQTVGINFQGRSIFIAVVMLTHVVLANLQLGGSWIAVGTERFYLKNGKERYNRLARTMTLFNVILFSLGATFASTGVLFFISLYPVFASNIFHVMWWPFFFEAVLFAAEIVVLLGYWYTWRRLSPRKHQALGYSYAVIVFVQTLMIDIVAAGMLTPGIQAIKYSQTGLLTIPISEAFAAWFNPTLWPLQWHRVFAAIGMVGLTIAMLGVFHFLDRKGEVDRQYWDWVASYSLSWGLVGVIAQPFIGLWYMLTIQQSNPLSFNYIMHGPRAWAMLLMIGVFVFLFLSAILYFIERREKVISESETRFLHKAFMAFFWIAVIFGIILVMPGWVNGAFLQGGTPFPLGSMNFKYLSLGVLVVIGALLLAFDTIFLADLREAHWGKLTRSARASLMLTGFFGMLIIVIMGFFRESARSPWTYYGIIPVPGGVQFPTPLYFENIFGVWVVIMAVLIISFWLTSKATAYHPEKADEVVRQNKG